MVGDRPDTDILLGFNAGIDRCLTLTGVVSEIDKVDAWIDKNENFKPNYIIRSFGILE